MWYSKTFPLWAILLVSPLQASFQERWYDSFVDHYNFEPVSPSTFPIRYFVDDQYYNGTSILFYAGNEAPIEQFLKNSGIMLELAQEFGSMVVFAEHRYYGKSMPFGPSSLQPGKNISYLTVEQAMQDFNTLNVKLRNESPSDNPAVLVFGGSYGANLALWLRLKNPNLWAGAIASSATPLKHLLRSSNAFAAIETEVYANVSADCPDLVRKGWKELLVSASNTQVQSKLGLCEPPENRDILHGWISDALETMVQYGYPYPTEFYTPLPAYPFAEACYRMISSQYFTGTGLDALRSAVDVYFNYTGAAGSCYNTKDIAVHSIQRDIRKGRLDRVVEHLRRAVGSATERRVLALDETTIDNVYIAWGYQCCTEVYQPMPTNGITDFEVPYIPNKERYFEACRQIWGVEPRPNWEEMTFMGSDIGTGSNIFLTNGQLDPWRAAGIQWQPNSGGTNDKDSSIIVRTIEHGAHHLDLRASHELDPNSVRMVRTEQKEAIALWIKDWNSRHLV